MLAVLATQAAGLPQVLLATARRLRRPRPIITAWLGDERPRNPFLTRQRGTGKHGKRRQATVADATPCSIFQFHLGRGLCAGRSLLPSRVRAGGCWRMQAKARPDSGPGTRGGKTACTEPERWPRRRGRQFPVVSSDRVHRPWHGFVRTLSLAWSRHRDAGGPNRGLALRQRAGWGGARRPDST